MADIKNYMEEKRKRDKKEDDFLEKINKYKTVNIYRRLLVVAAIIALILLIATQYKSHIYTGYDVVNSMDRVDYVEATDTKLGDHFLTYSKDGVHCTDTKGNVTWNQTYEIQDIQIASCNNTVAIGDYNGNKIYVLDAEKQISEIDTAYPVRTLTVSTAGYVSAVLDNEKSTFLNTYDPKGNLIYEGQTHMNTSGYPAAISLSPNGELLCASYWYVDAGILKTNVVFYNFGSVGANSNDFAVSGFTYTDVLVPQVQFINDSTAFAVGDSRLILYSGNHIPVETVTQMFDEEIQSVVFNDKYIGLVFRSEDGDYLYRMDVYDASTKKAENFSVGSFYIDIEYTDIYFESDHFVVYNDKQCRITTLKGVEKFNGEFDKSVRLMLPVGSTYKYLLVTDQTLDTIQLK